MIRKYHVEFYVSILSKKEINNMHPELAAEFWHYPLNLSFFYSWQCMTMHYFYELYHVYNVAIKNRVAVPL